MTWDSPAGLPRPGAEPGKGLGRTSGRPSARGGRCLPPGHRLGGDAQRFVLLALPYAPLDLAVTRAASPREAEHLRNFYVGVIGSAARVDVHAPVDRFHCGPGCAAERQKYMQQHLPTIQRLGCLTLDPPPSSTAPGEVSRVEQLRGAVAVRVRSTTLRRTARGVGMSAPGLQAFLAGSRPHPATIRKVESWYVRVVAESGGDLISTDATAALALLIRDLPEARQGAATSRLLEPLQALYEGERTPSPVRLETLRQQIRKAETEQVESSRGATAGAMQRAYHP